ncbi:MAG: hypothetical protein ABIQ70_07710, partial [Dokdonella sp.]
MWKLSIALSLASAFAQPPAIASEATTAHPTCSAASEYHQLDFWIGDWDTFETDTPNSPSEARAHIDPIAQGCALH